MIMTVYASPALMSNRKNVFSCIAPAAWQNFRKDRITLLDKSGKSTNGGARYGDRRAVDSALQCRSVSVCNSYH